MHGWMDAKMIGWMIDGRMDRWVDGWMDGLIENGLTYLYQHSINTCMILIDGSWTNAIDNNDG